MIKSSIFVIVSCFLLACTNRSNTSEQSLVTQPAKQNIEVDLEKEAVDTLLLTNTDTAVLVKQKPIRDDMGDQRKSYVATIYFLHQNWPALTYDPAIGAELFLVGDLDQDHQPEVLLKPEWFSSCWAKITLFSLKAKGWKKITSGNMYFCSDRYPLSKRIIKTDQGYALLTDSISHDRFITLKRDIKF